jgi:Domain of unknown function (DUF4407)
MATSYSDPKDRSSQWLELLLCKCSGGRMDVLQMRICEPERPKFAKIGVWVLIMSIIAYCSTAYAAWTVSHSKFVSIFVGCIGGLMTFNTDRYLIGESRKRKSQGETRQYVSIAVRLLLSLCISYVVSEPLKTLAFKGPIDLYLNEQNRIAATQLESKLKSQFPDIQILKDQIKSSEQDLNRAKASRDKAYNEMMSEGTGEKGDGKTGKFGQGDFYRQRQKELQQQESLFGDLKANTEQGIAENKKKLSVLEARAQAQRDSYQADQKSANTLPTQMSALHKISKTDEVIGLASTAITLMLIALEITPILAKTLSERGQYDAILERVEHEAISYEDRLRENDEQIMETKLSNQRKHEELLLRHEDELFTAVENAAHENLLDAIAQIHETALTTPEWQAAQDRAVSNYVNVISRQMEKYACSFYLTDKEFDRYVRPELVKMAQQYAQPIAEAEFQKRRAHHSQESLLKQLENKFRELTQKWK